MERFKVATCDGWTIGPKGRTPGTQEPGCTASVLDTAYAHREVKRYASETRTGKANQRLGRDGAIRAARAYATWLNRQPDLA